ncbi:MAG: lipoyl domain-containing protein [Dehalococcoidales bacterium]|nr:lipoyl domain-containing protein [Dehalococcoidales bacterium]
MSELKVVRLAYLHPRMDRNTLITWLKHEGDYVRRFEPLYVVETRKSTFEVCSEVEGVVDFLLVPQGGKVAVGQEIALIRCGE